MIRSTCPFCGHVTETVDLRSSPEAICSSCHRSHHIPQSPVEESAPWVGLKGTEFEDYVRGVFATLGYRVTTTKTRGELGVDFLVEGRGRKIGVLVESNPMAQVSTTAVHAVFTGKAIHGCDACAIITNGRFSAAALEVAAAVFCTVIDGQRLPELTAGQIYPSCDDPRFSFPVSPPGRADLAGQAVARPEKEKRSSRSPAIGGGCGCVIGLACIAATLLATVAVCEALGIDWRAIATKYASQAAAKVRPADPVKPSAAPAEASSAARGTPPATQHGQDAVPEPPAQSPEEREADQAKVAAERTRREAEEKARQEAEEREKAAEAERLAERRASAKLGLIQQLIKDGRIDTAKFRLQQLIRDYPKTKAAEEARQLLKRL
jgi:hypothetical protein